MVRRVLGLVLLSAVLHAFEVSAASESFRNDSGKTASGVAIQFSASVRVTSWDTATFPTCSPSSGRAESFAFSGGELEEGGQFRVSWSPSTVAVTGCTWITASTTPPAGNGSQGTTVQQAPRDVHHAGDLELSGNQVMTIEDVTYYQQGNISLLGNSKLIVRNATLIIVQEYHEQNNIRVDENAELQLAGAAVRSSFDLSNTTFTADARGTFTNARVEGWVVLEGGGNLDCRSSVLGPNSGGLIVADGQTEIGIASVKTATVRLSDVAIHEFSLSIYSTCSVTISDARPGNVTAWKLNPQMATSGRLPLDLAFNSVSIGFWDVRLGGNGSHTLERCQIFQLALDNSVSVTCRESSVEAVNLILNDTTLSLSDLRPGSFQHWILDLHSGGGPFLELDATSIEIGWDLRLYGGNYQVSDSTLGTLRPMFDDASSTCSVSNCCISELMFWWAHGTATLQNCAVGRIHTPDETSLALRGSFRISQNSGLDAANGPWRNGARVTRYFPVRVMVGGQPLVNTVVELRDKENRLVQSVRTDATGGTEVSVVFDETNNADTWIVLVPAAQWSQPLTLLSDTPICFPDCEQAIPLPCEQSSEGIESPRAQQQPQVILSEGSWPTWSGIGAQCTDPVERSLPGSRDILALRTACDSDYLYVRVELRGQPDPAGVSRYMLDISGDTLCRFVLDIGTLARFDQLGTAVSEEAVPSRTVDGAFEVALPLRVLPSGSLRIVVEARVWPDVVDDSVLCTVTCGR